MTILITGARGFIGSALWRYLACRSDERLVCVDKGTYAAVQTAEDLLQDAPMGRVVVTDICDEAAMLALITEERPHTIYHLAAESHVDRSIEGPEAFVQTNTVGTMRLLNAARQYWSALEGGARETFRFVHVSTDEVYGSLSADAAPSREEDAFFPNSPYSASKAAADHFARSYYKTYGLPVIVTHGSNTYGPWQFPEKLIPVVISKALAGEFIPLYGDGRQKREWLYVDDHAAAIAHVGQHGVVGGVYNIGSGVDIENRDLVREICAVLDGLVPRASGGTYADLITCVADRPGHDTRYALNVDRLKALGWVPDVSLNEGLQLTISWYLSHQDWLSAIQATRYDGRRLGMVV